jgi:DNA-binding CsgD family transcriptional regulator
MTSSSLAALPEFLAYLSTFPEPTKVLVALRSGMLRQYGVLSGVLWQLTDQDELVSIASFGHTAAEQERYAVVPLTLDLQVVQAVRENRLVVDDGHAFSTNYLGGIDSEFVTTMLTRIDANSVASFPVTHRGVTVGAFGFIGNQPLTAASEVEGVATAIAAALGIWMTHPQSGIASGDTGQPPRARAWALVLTERQQEILRRVDAGESTSSIAAALRTSESTVKQDLAHTMRVLRTTSRRTAVARAKSLGLLH